MGRDFEGDLGGGVFGDGHAGEGTEGLAGVGARGIDVAIIDLGDFVAVTGAGVAEGEGEFYGVVCREDGGVSSF